MESGVFSIRDLPETPTNEIPIHVFIAYGCAMVGLIGENSSLTTRGAPR